MWPSSLSTTRVQTVDSGGNRHSIVARGASLSVAARPRADDAGDDTPGAAAALGAVGGVELVGEGGAGVREGAALVDAAT